MGFLCEPIHNVGIIDHHPVYFGIPGMFCRVYRTLTPNLITHSILGS